MRTLIPVSIAPRLVVSLVLAISMVGVSYGAGGDMGADTEPLTNGSADYPYLIEDMADFDVFAGDSSYWANGVHTKLACDPNLAGRSYTTAVIAPDTSTYYGFKGVPFEGVFDGNGHIIRNLTIDTADADNSYLGLFGYISGSGAKVKNLGIENINITGGTYSDYLGGLCGWNWESTIINCYSTGSVTVGNDLGGLCGHNYYGTITNCYAIGSVTGDDDLGGLCGVNYGTISNCYATGSVTGGNDSYSLGGLCGENGGTITNCYATGSVTGYRFLGGLCGCNRGYFSSGTITDCYATGSVTGDDYLGGLCGENSYGTITNCYATGAVTGGDNSTRLGGLCGENSYGTITNCYATGAVTGGSDSYALGGLCGCNYDGTITNCYFYLFSGPDNSLGTALGNLQMQDAASFAGFDFADNSNDGKDDYWTIVNGYCPKLTWQTDDGPLVPDPPVTTLSGSGCSYNPFQINSYADFTEFRINGGLRYGYYILTTDIDLSGETFTTAVINGVFYGHFDGSGYIIRNITIDTAGADNNYLSLFSKIYYASVSNLGIENINTTGGYKSDYISGLCGWNEYSTITNCYATGSVTGGDGSFYLGGLCGHNDCGTITNCYATGSVTGGNGSFYLGGLCGYNDCGTITNCYATGSVTGDDSLGGLCGNNDDGTINNCYAAGSVTGGDDSFYLGGLCGDNTSGTITNCYATGSVTGGSDSYLLGGLCGDNFCGTITNCYATGAVTGGDNSTRLGGLCGDNGYGTITNCYATGSVTGDDYLGGLCGQNNYGTISNCYATGSVTGGNGSFYLGGLCGENYGDIINCFWDIETSGTTDGVGFQDPGPAGVVGGTTSQMQTQSTFADVGWLFADYQTGLRGWYMPAGSYPLIYWQNLSVAAVPDVTNMTLSETQGALTDAGLTLGNVFYINSWQIPEDVVTGLSASIYGHVDTSYPVDIYISAGSSGDGSQANPYEIACQADLDAVNNNLSMYYIMTADIYLGYHVTYTTAVIAPDTSTNYGFQGTSFAGVFDGDSHIVSNLTIDTAGAGNSFLGLFGLIGDSGAEIKNLGIENVNIIGGDYSDYLGGLCGVNRGTITNCYATGAVTGGDDSFYLGGLCGDNTSGTITNCYATGAVTGGNSSNWLGGLCGYNCDGTITNCYATGPITGDGGLGGLCGSNTSGTITNCYASGAVTSWDGSYYLGGLCASNAGTITNCYATGSVTGDGGLGGLCASNFGTITNCYASGAVTGGDGSYCLGGLCGCKYSGTISNCFWDVETSGMTDGVGNEDPDPDGVIGKTTEQMQTESTFTDANWDFSVVPVWHMPFDVVGYPMLGWQKDIPGDFTGGYGVGMDDWAVLADAWLSDDTPSVNWNEDCDLDGNGEIGVGDMKMFVENWLCD